MKRPMAAIMRRGSAALAAAGIAIRGIATSSFRITWTIDRPRVYEAVRLLHRRTLADVPDHQRADVETRLVAEHEQAAGGIARASELGLVDELVEPDDTRGAISEVLSRCVVVRGRHGNLPL